MTETSAEMFQASVERIAGAVNSFLQDKAEVVSLGLTCLLAEGLSCSKTYLVSGRPPLLAAWPRPSSHHGSAASSPPTCSQVT
jgi:hypothetical protein